MSKKVVLYPSRTEKGQSFKGVKRYAVPNQSMTLQEILRRFIRKESLPVAKEGVYEERFGDLEKLSKKDITEQFEVVEELKQVSRKKKKFDEDEKARIAKEKADNEAALSAQKASVQGSQSPESDSPSKDKKP